MRVKAFYKGMYSFVIVLLLLFASIFSTIGVSAKDNGSLLKKANRKYDIAVVFDNSGSMYTDKSEPEYADNKAWCRAKYSMEIFASMLDYDNGDKLSIYPMWPVTTDGKTNSKGSDKAIKINKFSDVDKINKIYTPDPLGTPFTPVKSAYNYLKKSDGSNEKWLIILTDGKFDDIKESDLKKKLIACTNGNVNVQYLGIGDKAQLDGIKDGEYKNFYVTNSSDTSLKEDLVDICNNIFERIELDKKYLKNKKLTLDISMSNLVVFAQGKKAKINSLKNSEGSEIKKIQDTEQIKYSTISAGGKYKNSLWDDTLAGQVVTFDSCPKGKYTLDYSGVESIQIFYEPDVYLAATLTDSEGNVISEEELSKGVAPGDYNVNFSLLDSCTNEDMTDSKLLAVKDIKGFITDENGNKTEIEDGEKITLKPDTKLKLDATASYLNGYKLSMSDRGSSLDINVNPPEQDKIEVKIKVNQLDNWYTLLEHEDWKSIRVNVTRDGKKLTDEELASYNSKLTFSDNLTYSYKMLSGESAYEVYVATDNNGKYVEPKEGMYELTANVSTKDEYGRTLEGKDSEKIRITKYPNWVKWVIVGLAFLLLALLVLLYLMRKALPPKVSFNSINSKITNQGRPVNVVLNPPKYKRSRNMRDGSLTIDMYPITMFETSASVSVTFKLKAVDRLLTTLFKPQKRRMEIVLATSDADEIIAGVNKYKRKDGVLKLVSEGIPILEDDRIILKKNISVWDNTTKRELKMEYLIIRKK